MNVHDSILRGSNHQLCGTALYRWRELIVISVAQRCTDGENW